MLIKMIKLKGNILLNKRERRSREVMYSSRREGGRRAQVEGPA